MVMLYRGHQTALCHRGECSHLETNEAESCGLAHNEDSIDAVSHDATQLSAADALWTAQSTPVHIHQSIASVAQYMLPL